MSITWSDVEVIAPELSTLAISAQTAILARVDRQISDSVWGVFANDGRVYLAAHYGTLVGRGAGGVGPVISESLGPMSRSYGWSGMYGALATTAYGLEYLRLLRLAIPGGFFVP